MEQQSDHAYHQGGPLPVGAHDLQAGQPACAQVQGAIVQVCAHYDVLRSAYHQGDQLSVGGQGRLAEPPDWGAVQECVHCEDPRWDAEGCRIQQHSRRNQQDGQVVQGCESSDVLPWDTGGRGEVIVGHGHQVDQLCQDEGDDELPQCEVPNEVDVLIGQAQPTRDLGVHTEQENDVSSSSPDGGGGLAKSRLCSNASKRFLLRS